MKNKERVGNPIKKAFIRKLYNDHFGINENITRDEINMMLNSPLTMGVISDESAPEYIKQATDIYNNKINKKIR
jgi:hypothetical protein